MAEESERVKQHTYQLNSNLVIQRDRSTRLIVGPSDEVKSLADITAEDLQTGFGANIKRIVPDLLKRPEDKQRVKKKDRNKAHSTTKRLRGGILEDESEYGYKPKTPQTQRVYDMFLNLVARVFSGESHELIKNCAEMSIEILRSDSFSLPQKKSSLEKTLKSPDLGEVRFQEFFQLAQKLPDFDEKVEIAPDEDIDVPIQFEEDAIEEVHEGEGSSESEAGDEESDGGEKGAEQKRQPSVVVDDDGNESVVVGLDGRSRSHRSGMASGSFGGGSVASEGFSSARSAAPADQRKRRETDRQEQTNATLSASAMFDPNSASDVSLLGKAEEIDLREIEAYWLQRKVSKYFKDPLEAQEKAQTVLRIMTEEEDPRFCENSLVELLGFEAFDLIKLLMKNRLEVVYCTRLAQFSEADRNKLVEEMKKSERLSSILDRLNRRTASLQDRTKKIREGLLAEAASLKRGAAGSEKKKFEDVDDLNSNAEGSESIVGCENKSEIKAFENRMNIDLESISFKQAGHTNTNKSWSLPKGSMKIQRKGFMEIYIPFMKPDQNLKLKSKSISDMPPWTHPSFGGNKKMSALNHVQSASFSASFESDENMLLCAPTGAGKTVVAQLCMLREIGKYFDEENHLKLDEFKIIYIAPMKSLVREMVNNFSERFQSYGICVRELSGDQQLNQEQISETQIIVTTPEKWDIITRKSGERAYTDLVRLVVIDEIHLLHDTRGPVLEAIVARSLRSTASSPRLVGLSATLPNFENVALFLRAPKKNVFFFDAQHRPCPLTQCFVGLTAASPYKRMELMNEICYEKTVTQRQNQQQVLIFVHSRRETFNTAKYLRDHADENNKLALFQTEKGASREAIDEELEHLKDPKLREALASGIAIHHAGLSAADRRAVEDLFADRHVSVLVSTATLAWGVNLPAHCVVIKGTQVYSAEKGHWAELSMLDVMQMTGRAGRPGHDSYGEAFVLTTQKELKYYMSLLTEQLPIESQMVARMADVLNAEIVLGTVSNVHEAIEWLAHTYLYVRMLAAPELYGVSAGDAKSDPALCQRRVDLVNSAAIVLDRAKLVHYDRKGAQFQATDFGKIAAHFYLTNQTMKTFRENASAAMSDIDILRVFSLASEFSFVTIREEEKLELAKMLDQVPIPVKESAEEPSAKVNVLLQTYISRLRLEGFQLHADMSYVVQSAGRLLRALFAVALRKGWAAVAKRCLALALSVEWRMWAIESPVRQFARGVAPAVLRRVERKEFPWRRWLDLRSHEIGSFIDHAEQGKKVFRAVHCVPRLRVAGQVQPITRSLLRVELALERDFEYDAEVHHKREAFWVFVEDVDGERLVHSEYFLFDVRGVQKEEVLSFTVPLFDPLPPQYFIRVFSDRFFGSETMLPITLSSLILPNKFPPPTELLDFTSQPVTAIKNPALEKIFDFKKFNAIQTQTFGALYKTDENVLVCAPCSSGKTACAELAILRMISEKPDGKCVCIAPMKEIAVKLYRNWQHRFGRLENISVALLTGDLQYDQKLLGLAKIVVTDATNWNGLQRLWRRRKSIQNVSLFIMDNMHLLTSLKGHVFEECISRMRYIASQTEHKTRFIGLATSVANAQDLGEWIGCRFETIFNFPPSARPMRLDLSLTAFETHNFDARLLAMARPAFAHIVAHAGDRPALVFAPSRRLARVVATDFVGRAAAAGTPERFLHVRPDEMEAELACFGSELLRSVVRKGVAFYHARMTEKEKRAVCNLVKAGAIQVVVAERTTCWDIDIEAFLVVVLGTKHYDGATQSLANAPVFELLQMLGHAARPGRDSSARALVLCEAPRRAFLKKFLDEPFPVESALDGFLEDYLNAEVVNGTVENAQEAVDFLTWTFLYRRLHQNPNFYNLFGTSNRHISEYLSKLAEDTLESLQNAGCVKVDDGGDENDIASITPLNLGHIASYYDIRFGTMELFASVLSSDITLRRLLELLSSAEEFLDLPLRPTDAAELRRLARSIPLALSSSAPSAHRSKTHSLLQAHFSRAPLSADLAADRDEAVCTALRLLYALVDAIASRGWLRPALSAMELCQMLTQAAWDSASPLLQLPFVDEPAAERLRAAGVESPLDLCAETEAAAREALAVGGVTGAAFAAVVAAANAFPNPALAFEVASASVKLGEPVSLSCRLLRDGEDDDNSENNAKCGENGAGNGENDEKCDKSGENDKSGAEKAPVSGGEVFAPRFPGRKAETWWALVGDAEGQMLLGIKRVAMTRGEARVALDFVPPSAGRCRFRVYLMSDSYVGVDQEYELEVDVKDEAAKSGDAGDGAEREERKRREGGGERKKLAADGGAGGRKRAKRE